MLERFRHRAISLAVVAWVATAGSGTVLGEELYTFAARPPGEGQLFRYDVDSGATTAVGLSQPGAPHIASLTAGTDGQLYGLAISDGVLDLIRIDPSTGAVAEVGSTGVAFALPHPPQLSADGAGGLWLTLGTGLYPIDPATGDAGPAAELERPVHALASRDGRLYAVTVVGDDQGEGIPYGIEELELATATLVPLAEFTFEHSMLDAAFDRHGRLRLMTPGGGILTHVHFVFHRIDDLADPKPVQTHFAGYPVLTLLAGIGGLSEMPAGAAVEVPASGMVGKTLLALALMGAAFALLRRP